MSAVVHHSDADYPTLPKRFTCGRKCKDGGEYTRVSDLVECPQCRAKLKERREQFAASSASGEPK